MPGFAEAAEADKSPYAGSGLITGTPKPLRHKEVPGFLSAAQIAPHHTAHHAGTLKAFAGVEDKFEEQFTKGTAIDAAAFERLKQLQSSRGNSVILHELYFDGLALKATDPPEGIKKAIEKRFGSLARPESVGMAAVTGHVRLPGGGEDLPWQSGGLVGVIGELLFLINRGSTIPFRGRIVFGVRSCSLRLHRPTRDRTPPRLPVRSCAGRAPRPIIPKSTYWNHPLP